MEFSVYLSFDGTCKEAMNFYKDALDANLEYMQTFGESPVPVDDDMKDRILHSVLEKDGFKIMGSDSNRAHPVTEGNNCSVSIDFRDGSEIDGVFNAISAGGNVTMPLQDTFWGARFGMCTDKFGISWLFNHDKPKEA